MKTGIIYFSQTVNTEMIARAIQSGIHQITNHCDILRIQDANPKRLYKYEYFESFSPDESHKIMEYYLKKLDDAEAEGRFRKLVPKESIGWDTPHFKVHNKHPRWIIGRGWA